MLRGSLASFCAHPQFNQRPTTSGQERFRCTVMPAPPSHPYAERYVSKCADGWLYRRGLANHFARSLCSTTPVERVHPLAARLTAPLCCSIANENAVKGRRLADRRWPESWSPDIEQLNLRQQTAISILRGNAERLFRL